MNSPKKRYIGQGGWKEASIPSLWTLSFVHQPEKLSKLCTLGNSVEPSS